MKSLEEILRERDKLAVKIEVFTRERDKLAAEIEVLTEKVLYSEEELKYSMERTAHKNGEITKLISDINRLHHREHHGWKPLLVEVKDFIKFCNQDLANVHDVLTSIWKIEAMEKCDARIQNEAEQ